MQNLSYFFFVDLPKSMDVGKVKLTDSDPTYGYLADKVDLNIFSVDTQNWKLTIKDNVFAPFDHTHTTDDITDIDKTSKQANTILFYNGTEYVHIPYNENFQTETEDFLYTSEEILKGYAAYLGLDHGLYYYQILVAKDSDSTTQEYNLIKLDPQQSVTFTVNLTNVDNKLPTKVVLGASPNLDDFTYEVSFDNTNWTSYQNESELDVSGHDTLYVKVTNTSASKTHYFVGFALVSD